jgi:nitrite reductase (NADH) large subunit
MAVGIKPNIELAQKIGLHCERGIVVDDTLQTFDPCIYAVGECVQHRRNTFGLVAPIWDQARVCAIHLAGLGHRRYVQATTSTRLKVTGIDLFSAGDFIGGKDSDDLLFRDPRRGVYKRLVVRDNRLMGVVLYGDVKDGNWYFDLIQNRTDISINRDRLVFGRAFCEAA